MRKDKKFAEAEGLLIRARAEAAAEQNLNAEQLILTELIELYCVMEPPDTKKAELLSLQREAIDLSARAKLQTGMLLYWHKHEPAEALAKLTDALIEARKTGDFDVAYSCLALSVLDDAGPRASLGCRASSCES